MGLLPSAPARVHSNIDIDIDIDIDIQKLKVGKAAGVCGIRGEMLKTGGEPAVRWMTELCRMV